MQRIIFIIALEAWAIALAFLQSMGGGVRTDEAKYLLNIPYPQPPLVRTILSWTETLSFQEMLWRILFATLLVQAVWFVWDLSRSLPREHRFVLALGWLFSASVLFQTGTIMMAPLTALQGLIFVWLALNRSSSMDRSTDSATGSGLVIGLLWLASLFTAYQAVLYLPLIWVIFRRRGLPPREQIIYLGFPIAIATLYTLTNPLAAASFLNAGGENLNIPFVLWFWYLARLWMTGGSLALTMLGIFGCIRSRHYALIGSFLLVSAFCFVSFREYYDILFTPLFIGGAFLYLRTAKVRIPLVPFLIVLLGTTALAFRFLPPISDLGPAREVMNAIEARDQTGEVLIHKYFGHGWQWESDLPIRRYKLEFLEQAQAVVCINPCEGLDVSKWRRLPEVSAEVWVR